VASVAVLVHWLDAAPALLVTALIVAAAAAGTGPIVGEWRPWRMPLIPMALPALAAFSIAGIARVVAPVPWLPLLFVAGWAGVAWAVRLETAPEVLHAVMFRAWSPSASLPRLPLPHRPSACVPGGESSSTCPRSWPSPWSSTRPSSRRTLDRWRFDRPPLGWPSLPLWRRAG